VGPVGDFWRCWLYKTYQEPDEIFVHTVDGFLHRFNISTGELIETMKAEAMPKHVKWWWRTEFLAGAAAVLCTLIGVAIWQRVRRARKGRAEAIPG
jgi:hypothetical protein